MDRTNDLRIKSLKALISPNLLLDELPISSETAKQVNNRRRDIANVLAGKDPRLVVVVGPCSIHDPVAAIEYAGKLQKLSKELDNELVIIMRVYFEKPRTTVGWKGLINDPSLNGEFHINRGLKTARQLLLDINQLGLATGTEFLDTMIPQYISDLVSWAAIGARTSESQIHRELASGLSMPVGFKNGTTGNIQIAVDAVMAASQPHHFLGVSKDGVAAIVGTSGNENCHVILRGSNIGPNYDLRTIATTTELLTAKDLRSKLMLDCSHGNSQKDDRQQLNVIKEISQRISNGEQEIFGLMIESNLLAGNQKLVSGKKLAYGQSITDKCINWKETKKILQDLALSTKKRKQRAGGVK